MDPDGKETTVSFNYNKYVESQFYAMCRGLRAGIKDTLGQIGNFFCNLFTKHEKSEIYYGAELTIGGMKVIGTSSKSGETFTFSASNDAFSLMVDGLQEITDLPISIKENEISITANDCTISITKNGEMATLTVQGDIDFELSENTKISVCVGVDITVSTQTGPFGTILNRQNKDINQDVQYYNYVNSGKYVEDLME